MDHEERGEVQLTSAERDVLWAWAQHDIAPDFAERMAQLAASPSRARPRWRTAGWTTGALVAAAALLVTMWLARESRPRASEPVVAAVTDAPPDLARLREDVRMLLAEHCVPCHDGDSGGAEKAALAVFEVTDVAWAGRLSDARLETTRERLLGMGLDESDEVRVERFVTRELTWRTGGAG
jgi:hypothetical protein